MNKTKKRVLCLVIALLTILLAGSSQQKWYQPANIGVGETYSYNGSSLTYVDCIYEEDKTFIIIDYVFAKEDSTGVGFILFGYKKFEKMDYRINRIIKDSKILYEDEVGTNEFCVKFETNTSGRIIFQCNQYMKPNEKVGYDGTYFVLGASCSFCLLGVSFHDSRFYHVKTENN